MHSHYRTLLPALCLTLAGATTTVAAADAPQLSLDTMKSLTKELSSDAFEGRAPGTIGEEKTLALLEKEFSAAGIKPGNNGSWFQDVPLVEITAENVSPLVIKGAEQELSYQYGPQMVLYSDRVTPRTEVKDSEMVFVGYGIHAPERDWNDYADVDVTGKTVVILVNDPDYETEGLEGPFNGRAMTYYGRWSYKFEEAARQGAAAALIVHDTEPAAYGWNVVESSNTGPQHVADAEHGHMDQTLANGWLQYEVAEEVLAAAGQDLAALSAAAKKPGFKAVELGLKASVSFDNKIEKQLSKNVVGILPGSDRPDEYVLYTAHWDHLGRCGADETGDDICNGAIDNATGTAALVALAQAHVAAGPAKRSIVFLAVTAEESGLLGSESYAANPVYPLENTVGGVNMDAFSMTGLAKDVVVVGKGKSELDAYLERAVEKAGREVKAEPTPEKGFYYRSDHFSLAKRGVPMLYFKGGMDLVNGGVEAGMAAAKDYGENRYHAPKDEYDPNWDWGGTMADLRLYYRIARDLANSEEWPNWVEGDEFRAVRDESRAGK
ncbi:M28 family peptidase [Parahaliea sp. F7430]|uniref:M28 family peptidase n=1 Tax=Sediminihaliea albiluteola TaxID=2758564 RepID=A0A7W2TUP9_9GAMM|nr:M28 family metallopeptidase [Sediminihaliea albiluteola]MBA6412277.1 M28 family peptidase [Sediminihaliea albiluteola]